ncbi:MAG: hypothetical protein JSS64_14710 [Bacteroidetes bacterium]|nr:hypothetical protein [Bacteroidota bacterium]
MRQYALIVFCCLLNIVLKGQTPRLDHLRNQILLTQEPSQKSLLIRDLLSYYRSLSNDTLWHYCAMLRQIGGTDLENRLTSELYRVYYFSRVEKPDSAHQIIRQNLSLARPLTNKSLYLHFSYLDGYLLTKNSAYKDAVKSFLNTLRLSEAYKDTNMQVRCLNGVGWAYLEMNQPQESLIWLDKAAQLAEGDRRLTLLPLIYLNKSSCWGALSQIDSAQFYNQKSIYFSEATDDLHTMANALAIRSNIQLMHNNRMGAIQSVEHAVEIRKHIGDPYYIVSDLTNLADAYSYISPQKAIVTATEAADLARKSNLKTKLAAANIMLAQVNMLAGKYKDAATILMQTVMLKDTIYQQNKAEELAEVEAKYDLEKKDAAIQLLQKENELQDINHRNTLFQILGASLIMLSAIVGYLLFASLQRKRRRLEEKAAQEKSRLQEMIKTQEDERKRISADLHDGVSPILSAIKLNLSQIKTPEQESPCLNKALELIDISYQELRQLSHQLMPSILTKKGLTHALQQMANDLSTSKRLSIWVSSDLPDQRYSSEIEVNLYRIVQELVNNIVRYAEASEVQIQITHENKQLNLMVEDNGMGFDATSLQTAVGNGWSNILSRLTIVQGNIEVDTRANRRGTVVFVVVPLP